MQIPNHSNLEVIGVGGMATVYCAEHVSLKQKRALKVMSSELTREPGFRESFLREGQMIAGLQHPNIITIHDLGQSMDGHYYMSMELIRGGDLKEKLVNRDLTPETAFTVLNQIGRALQLAHDRGLIHRDIKPANILFRENGEAVLTDFGISKLQGSESELTRHGFGLMGTLRYMSPEQTNSRVLDARSDQYSLALVLYEMLTGKAAIHGDTTSQIIRGHVLDPPPELPEKYSFLQPVLNKALSKEPEERFHDLSAFLYAVRESRSFGNKTIITKNENTTQPRRIGRYKQYFVVLCLLLLFSGGVFWWIKSKSKPTYNAPAVFAPKTVEQKAENQTKPTPVSRSVPVDPVIDPTEKMKVQRMPILTSDLDAKSQLPSSQPVQNSLEESTPDLKKQGEVLAQQIGDHSEPAVTAISRPVELAVAPAKKVEVKPVSAAAITTLPVKPSLPSTQPDQNLLKEPITDQKKIQKLSLTMKIKSQPYAHLYQLPDGKRLGKVNNGSKVYVIGEVTKDGLNWKHVQINAQEGYIKARDLKF